MLQKTTDGTPPGLSPTLIELEKRIPREIAIVEGHPEPWVPKPRATTAGVPHHSVVICGAGLSGLGLGFALRRRGVNDFLLVDRNPPGREGPWVTSARMKTLRSPKYLASLDLGIPSLTMRAWFEASYGTDAWQALDKPSKEDWMAYLLWFRRVVGIDVENHTTLIDVAPDPAGLRLSLRCNGEDRTVAASRLVLATGMEGGGGPHIPQEVAQALPADRFTHSGDAADDKSLKGKDIVVLGGQTSAFDWSVTALEQGARSVVQLSRAPDLPRTEALAWMDFPGFMGHFADLPAAQRWRFMHQYFKRKIPPTQDQYDRAQSFDNFRLVSGTQENRFSLVPDGRILIENGCGTFLADHLLLGTGYCIGPELRVELRCLADHFATWGDAFAPPQEDPYIACHPYLGNGFEMTPKTPQDTWVSRVHCYNASAIPSLGPISNGITGLKYGVPRLADALVGHLFAENLDTFFEGLKAFDVPHFDPRPAAERIEKDETT